jgi:glucokinase
MVLRAWVEDDGGGGLRVRIMKSSNATRSETETLTVASIEDASAAVRDWLEALATRN